MRQSSIVMFMSVSVLCVSGVIAAAIGMKATLGDFALCVVAGFLAGIYFELVELVTELRKRNNASLPVKE